MSMSNVLIGGAHRGALSILNELPDKTVRQYDPNWKIADPKDNRAAQLTTFARNRFPTLRPHPFQMKVQDALAYCGDDDVVALALDTLTDTAEALAARRLSQRASFQLVGRGPGDVTGTRLGIHGTICPGDHEAERRALLLLQTLAGMSQPTSSRNLTGRDPLMAAVMTPLRQAAARQTAKHLEEKEREPQDLSGGPLSVMFGPTVYPLIPVRGGSQDTHSHWEARALDAIGEVPANHAVSRRLRSGFAMVAVVIPEARAIHFMKVAQSRTGKRSVAGVTSFVSPRVQPQSQSAFFTD
jgi:hypothetical protein